MKKRVTLQQIGWKITGEATVQLWDGSTGTIEMNPTRLMLGTLTKKRLRESINDAKFGAQKILSATVHVYEMYQKEHYEYRTELELDEHYCELGKRGI